MLTTKNTKKINKHIRLEKSAKLFPNDSFSQKVLLDRAERLAKSVVDDEENKHETIAYIKFRLGENEYYGIPYDSVKEVIINRSLTKLPYAPSCVAGVINLRGKLLTILDLNNFFKIQDKNASEKKYIIVAEVEGMTVGLIVNNIEGSNHYDISSLDLALSSENAIHSAYVLGLHQGKTTILNIKQILTKGINNEYSK